MSILHHFDLSLGLVTRVDRPPRLSRDASELLMLVEQHGGDIPVALGWTCRIGHLREANGEEQPGAANVSLFFRGAVREAALAIVGVSCWKDGASRSAWRLARRMRDPLIKPDSDKSEQADGPPVPWLATINMPLSAQVPDHEMAVAVDRAADLTWALIASDEARA